MYGTCRFCGDTVILANEPSNQEEEIEMAILACDCAGAMLHKTMLSKAEIAKDNIDLEFNKDCPEVAEILKKAVEYIAKGKITKISVDTGRGVKAAVNKTSRCTIKVSRTETEKVEHDE